MLPSRLKATLPLEGAGLTVALSVTGAPAAVGAGAGKLVAVVVIEE